MAESDRIPKPPPPVKGETKTEDVVLVHGRTADGKGLEVLRKKGDELSAGQIRPVEDGKPLTGDLVKLTPRPEMPLLCDVDVEYEAPRSTKAEAGPARVSSSAYRKGWDRMWGKRKSPGKAN
ncbi:MAG: hypothetical protein JJ863_06450 [Deltaproteobacteria bacterium]|nr:hypothetical protein [Deltaproteobacteria bacterium]